MGRAAAAALLLAVVLAAAACGGSSGSATGTTASGADIAPANALAFFSINTDQDSDQWQQATELLQKFPIRKRARAALDDALADEGLDFEDDIRPALGPTFDVVLLDTGSDETEFVGLTQPEDEDRFIDLLNRADEPIAHATIGGWTAISDHQAALDAFRDSDATLADDDEFTEAMQELPEEANVVGFLNGSQASRALGNEVPGLPLSGATEFKWVSFALSSQDNGWKIDGAAKGGPAVTGTLDWTLLDRVPSGALAAIAFKGASAATLERLRKDPDLSRASAQVEQLLGVRLQDVVDLLSGDTVLYVRQGSPFPEATLVTKPKNVDGALRTLDNVAGRISAFAGGTTPTRTKIGSIDVRKIPLGPAALYYGIDDGRLVASTSTAPFHDVGGPSLEDDPVYKDAAEAVDLPLDANAIFYVNIRDATSVVEGLAQVAGEPLPRDLSSTLEPLESLFGYSTTENGIAHFSSLLQVS